MKNDKFRTKEGAIGMTLIDGDKIITAQLYDDEYEEFKEEKMSIIDYINAYTDEGVTVADDVLDKIRAEVVEELNHIATEPYDVDDYQEGVTEGVQLAIRTINKKINERTNSGGNVTNEEIEEAIDLLDNLIGVIEDNHNSDYDKAIKMGIEALKRLSNTSNDERR